MVRQHEDALRAKRSGSARKTIAQLRKEQGIPPERPEYFELASRVWRTRDEVAEFDGLMKAVRRRTRSRA